MSAITGFIDLHKPIDNKLVETVNQLLYHCGNNNKCVSFTNTKVNQAKSFSSIIACYSGSQKVLEPFWNNNHDKLIAFDGEIYNTDKLKNLLLEKGVSFHSNNICELLLILYETSGLKNMLNAIDGIWGMCVVDNTINKIYIIRDCMGEKPLYFYKKDNVLLFSSEIKAFYAYPGFIAELNEDAVSEYFVFRYPCGNSTFLKGVYLVSPGCYLEISESGINERSYWRLPISKPNNLTKEENRQHLRNLLKKSVKNRLSGGDNIGAQLSGGVDSSYLCYEMNRNLGKSFNTYSITFEGTSVDESQYVDFVNSKLQLTGKHFDCKPIDFLLNWEDATWFYESPLNHEGTVPLLQLNHMAKLDGISTILCGDGADESLGGYPIFRRIDGFKRDLFGLRWYGVKTKAKLKGKPHFNSLDEHFISLHQFIDDSALRRLRPTQYKKDLQIAYKNRLAILQKFKENDFLHKYTNYDLCTYGLDCLLRTKKMAMAYGVTVRSPFLMTQLQEFIQTIPSKYLTDYGQPYMQSTKILLKELCADIFGDKFVYRPKIGLGVPLQKIFKDCSIRKYIEGDILPYIQKRGIVNFEYIKELWNDTLNHTDDETYPNLQVLWCVFSFEIWAKIYLDTQIVDNFRTYD